MRKARTSGLPLLLTSLVVCLIVATVVAGCSSPSVAGVYSPSSFPSFRLDLKSDSTYIQTVNDLEPRGYSEQVPLLEVAVKTYRGTFTVKDKRVLLNGEPDGVNSFKIVGRNLKGPYGLWVRQPAAKK